MYPPIPKINPLSEPAGCEQVVNKRAQAGSSPLIRNRSPFRFNNFKPGLYLTRHAPNPVGLFTGQVGGFMRVGCKMVRLGRWRI
jgi:hypothetical protein